MDETFLEVRGCKLFLRRAGAGAPLLFLHGAQGLTGWPAALAELSKRFEVLAPDHPGFGRSDTPDWIEDVPDLAFFYQDLLDALDLREIHLVGHSLGGWTAMEMAVRSTARLKSLTLAAAAGIRVPGVPRADMFICSPEELARLLFAGEGWQEWQAQWQATPELQDAYDKNRFAAAKYCWQPRLFDPRLARWLHRIDRPTHIVWGEEDRILPPAYAAALTEAIAGATLTMLPGCGHLAYLERPDLFSAELLRFIERRAA